MDAIYLDHNATTPVRPEAAEAVARCLAEVRANPASQHQAGQKARQVLEDARERIAAILDVRLSPPERDRLLLTSGGTEANNLAVLGIALAAADPPGRIIISAAEHQSVIEPAERLLELGWRMDTLGLTTAGVVRAERLGPLLADAGVACRLVSIMLANHETGVVQPIEELAAVCRRSGVPLHTDAVQAVGKMPVGFRKLGAAAMSFSAHKFGGPPGVGALAIRGDVPLQPLMYGGHQQSGLRPGTEAVALAVGMAVALELRQRELEQYSHKMSALREQFEGGLFSALPGIVVHGAAANRLPQTSSVAFPDIDGEMLRIALDLAGVACSVGAACESGSTELSPTLRAMELPKELVASSLRFSFGWTTTASEIDAAVARIAKVCRELG